MTSTRQAIGKGSLRSAHRLVHVHAHAHAHVLVHVLVREWERVHVHVREKVPVFAPSLPFPTRSLLFAEN